LLRSHCQSPSDLINREKVEDHELDPFSLNTEAGRWLKAEQEYYKSRGDITYSPVTAENDVGEKQLQDAFKECERRHLHEENFENSSPVLLISTNVSKDWIPPEYVGKGIRFLVFHQVAGSPLFLTYMPGQVHGAAAAFVARSIGLWQGRSDLLNSVLGGGLSSGNYGTYQPDIRIYPKRRNKDTNGCDKDRKNGDLPYTRLYWEVEHGNRDPVAIRQRGQRYMACPYTRFFLACKIFNVSDGALRAGIVLWGKTNSDDHVISVLAAVSFGTTDLTREEKGEFETARHDRLVGVKSGEWTRPEDTELGEMGDTTPDDWKLRIPYQGILYRVTTKRSGTRGYLLEELNDTDEVADLVIDLRRLALAICDPDVSDSEADEE
jgi:hypothetical protein